MHKYYRARPYIAASLAAITVFAVAISAWGLVEKISLPEQKPLLDSILWFMTWLAALAFGAGAWALAYAEVKAREAHATTKRVLNTSLHGFEVLKAEREGGGEIRDFRLVFANKAASELLGLDFDQFVGRSMLEIGGDSLDQEAFEKFRNVVETGDPVSFERHHQVDGKSRWLSTRAAKFEDGVVSTFADVTERKLADEQALKDQKLLEITGRMTRSGGWDVSFPDRKVSWSREVYDIHEVEEGFAPNFSEAIAFYPPGSQERIVRAFETCAAEGKPYDLELEFVTAKGRPLWVHTIGRAEFDEMGILRRIFGTFQDITEYKKSEIEALASKEQLQMALSGAAMGRWDWDVPGGILNVDENVARILGYELAEMKQTIGYWNSLIHPEDFSQVAKAAQRHLSGEDPIFEAEYRMKAKNEEWIWVLDRGKGMKSRDGKVTQVVGTLLDVTAKKLLEEERISNLEVLEKITSQVPGAVYQYRVGADNTHSFVYVSGRIQDVYDRSAEELMADVERGYDLIHPDDAERIRQSAYKADSPSSEWRQEFRIYRKGELRWILDQSTPEILADGGTLWHGFLMDITDQKVLDQQLLQAKEGAEDAGRAKAEFLAMMSHEIRTPMNAILGFADLLAQRPLSGQERDYVHTIASSGEALLRIIDDILDHSRIESGRLRLESSVFSPQALLDDISVLLTPSAEKKGLGLEVITIGEIPERVRGDMGRLRQIILNLAGNAVKFTPAGVVALGVEIAPGEPDPGLIRMRFFVRDAGPGIPAKQAARIFEPFAQGDSSVSRRHGGTGLGLAISRSLATLMGGYLWFESEPGEGSIFLLEIPFGLPEQVAPEVETPAAEVMDANFAVRNPLRILAVDDDAVNLKLIEHVLHKFGYTPTVAGDGEESIAICEREWPDCILLDVQMPGMDGLMVARRLREIESSENRPPIFIAALTANVLAGERQACLEAGMNGYLTKPLRKDQLAHLLAEASRAAQYAVK